jgi:hypothetical protein
MAMIFSFTAPLTILLWMMLYDMLKLLFTNMTTIERLQLDSEYALEHHQVNIYDLGWKLNVYQVMGGILGWILPLKPVGNGHEFTQVPHQA